MNNDDEIKRLLKKFNRNIPLDNQYTIDEIKAAFFETSYSSGNDKEKILYNRFFIEFASDNDIKLLCKIGNVTTTKLKKLYLSYSDEQKIEFGEFWFKRFRIAKPIGKLLPRNHKKYKEIENFKTYELTPCIAYEMAIRNQNVKDLLKKYDKISSMMLEDKYLYKRHRAQHNYVLDKEYPLRKYITNHNFKEYYKLVKKEVILDSKYEKYLNQIVQVISNYTYLIETDYKNFIDNHIDTCTELSMLELELLKEKIENELVNNYLIYPTSYIREIKSHGSIIHETITNEKKYTKEFKLDGKSEGIISEHTIYDEFIQIQTLYANSKEYSVNHIFPNFHRQVNDQNQITIPINLSLPLEEINEYIKIVKKKIDIKSPIELLGEKLNKADNLTNMQTLNDKGKKFVLDAQKGEKAQQKIANLFYIYDMKQKAFTNKRIIDEIFKYYNDKKEAISENTIKKYFEIAKDYIENERYKELITGKTSLK